MLELADNYFKIAILTMFKGMCWDKLELNKWSNIHCSQIGIFNIMSILSKLIYRFNEIPIKILSGFFFCGSWQVGSKIHMDSKDLECIKHLWKIKQLGEHTLPDFNVDYIKLHYQNMEAWCEEKKIDQWYRKESPQIDSHIYV